jgi:hypothetical protein
MGFDCAQLHRLARGQKVAERRRRGQKVARGKREARRPWIAKIIIAGPKGRQNTTVGACLSPRWGSRRFLKDPGAACSLRFALAPGYLLAVSYLLAAPPALSESV